ncbi:hypothetical protein ACT53J_02615 [Citrobacter braakii]|uniref:hypothetical protein n=1 Tax=Citrobacter braakii TaxID=57706 RepID=UPI004033C3CB
MKLMLDSFTEWLGLDLDTLLTILKIIATLLVILAWPFKVLLSRKKAKAAAARKIKKFPLGKVAEPYFRLESSNAKSVKQFKGFFDTVDHELIELDVVICEDELGLISVSRSRFDKVNELTSDHLVIWTPYRSFENGESAHAGNSEGFALNIIYTPESDASLYYSRGCWYLKGFFTELNGFTNNGVCSITLRAEKVQSRN